MYKKEKYHPNSRDNNNRNTRDNRNNKQQHGTIRRRTTSSSSTSSSAPPLPIDPKLMECPICLDTISLPVSQCEVGHSMCKRCCEEIHIVHCPICKRPMSKQRHVAFEQLLTSFKNSMSITCCYAHIGCKFDLTNTNINKEDHEKDCRFRKFSCEGKSFLNWKCNWVGSYEDIEKHFKEAHKEHSLMQYSTKASIKINFNKDFKDIQFISFFNGQAYFYYKHLVDMKKEKIYWLFQYIGLKHNAEHFFYEFELQNGPINKFKIAQQCYTDTTNWKELIKLEKCVVISFATVRNYLTENGELPFRFRLMKFKVEKN